MDATLATVRDLLPTPSALLLCGDGTVSRAALERAVADAGFEVAAVVSRWMAAVEWAVQFPVDAVVVDLALAGKLGVRLVATLRAAAPTTPVIVVTPLSAIDLVSIEAGAVEVVDPSDLRPLVHALLRIGAERTHA